MFPVLFLMYFPSTCNGLMLGIEIFVIVIEKTSGGISNIASAVVRVRRNLAWFIRFIGALSFCLIRVIEGETSANFRYVLDNC